MEKLFIKEGEVDIPEDKIVKAQSFVRRWLAKRQYAKRKKQQAKRVPLIHELISTEKIYIEQLGDMVEVSFSSQRSFMLECKLQSVFNWFFINKIGSKKSLGRRPFKCKGIRADLCQHRKAFHVKSSNVQRTRRKNFTAQISYPYCRRFHQKVFRLSSRRVHIILWKLRKM